MTSRRRLLQIIASSFKWIAHSFTNLYYSLIPTTISGKKVQDKAKVVKAYGNSEVKNQLARTLFDTTQNGITFTASNSGRKVVLSGTSSGYFIYTVSFGTTLPANSVVLVSIKVKNPNNVFFGYRLRQNNITPMDYSGSAYIQVRTITSAIDCIQFYGNPNIDYTGVEIEDVQLVCLTQRFPFNTPTTLTDPRVQKILNGGYEEYNLGEIVDVDMGEIDSEPYNLLVSQPTYSSSVVPFNSQTFTKLMANKPYTLEFENLVNATSYRWCLSFYNENGEIIKDIGLFTFSQTSYFNSSGLCLTSNNIPASTKKLSITPKVNCYIYVNFGLGDVSATTVMNNVCLHLTGTRTGYAPHTQPYTLPFKYQGSGVGTSHDTLEDGGTE